MRSLTAALIVLGMIALVGFTIIKTESPISSEPVLNEEIVPVSEETNSNLTETSLVEYKDRGIMKASWYGPQFHGNKTANGEIFDQMAFTAAHKSLKFGTLLRVTNPKNNKTVVVRINDRGPFIHGRDLDLSKAAAIELGIIHKGVAKLEIEEISLKGVGSPVITLN